MKTTKLPEPRFQKEKDVRKEPLYPLFGETQKIKQMVEKLKLHDSAYTAASRKN